MPAKIPIRDKRLCDVIDYMRDAMNVDGNISGHIQIYQVGDKKVLDLCYVCGKLVTEDQPNVTKGQQVYERIIHKSCEPISKENQKHA